ncbi:MAG: glycosyltransferase [Candidatus Limnocylindrales bacterium]
MTERRDPSPDRHILMITNHGVHEWQVTPGLPDTGGQNVYVNQLTEALLESGYRVTIVNRGGYPHPLTGAARSGVVDHSSGRARILYIEDGTPSFVRKEDMDEHVPHLAADLHHKLVEEGVEYDLLISHYWDGAKIGVALDELAHSEAPHIWVPHSLGALKKRNSDPSTWANLRIDERIVNERALLGRIDGAVATSSAIRDTFVEDYGYQARYFLPPCVDPARYHARSQDDCAATWDFLTERSPYSASELRRRKIVLEISRTDRTKRKDVLIQAFAQVRELVPESLLVVALDDRAGDPYEEAVALIRELDLERDVVILGSVWEQLPCLYAAAAVYCTPSVMEGFGMSAQEAAATAVPVVASNLVPFAAEYLLGGVPKRVHGGPGGDLQVGEGAIVVPADDVYGFARALTLLLNDDALRDRMGRAALGTTVPYFTWAHRTRDLLDDLGLAGDTEPDASAG